MRPLLAVLLVPSLALAQAKPKTQLPQEIRGTDPKPDTDQAARLLKSAHYTEAIQQAKLALGRDEKYTPAMVVMAKAYYYQHKYELATAIIDIAKSIDASCSECYNLLGFIALDKQPPDRISATAAFKKAAELNSGYGAAWNNLAAQYLYAKNYDGALDAAQHAAQLMPNFSKAHLNLGSALRGKGQYPEAEREYKKALDLEPNYPDALFNLGILYLDAKEMPGTDLVGKYNASITWLQRYKQAAGPRINRDDPSDQYMSDARKEIDREQKKQERLRKQQERDKAKGAPAAASPAPAGKVEGK
jgi:tetratricopeptide (TPR) repeat protein